MPRPFAIFAALLLAAASEGPARATFLTLDQFSAGTTDLNITAAAPPTLTSSETQTGLSGVIGGSRNVLIQKLQGLSGSTRNVQAAVDATNLQFAYISGNGVIGSMTLTYDGGGAGLNTFVSVTDTILLNFIDGDYSPTRQIPITMTITAANNQTGTLTQTLAVSQAPYVMEFDVGNFSNLGGMDLTTNSVKSFSIAFAPTATSTDFTLAAIEVVPEPSTYAFVIFGALGAFALSRRCRKSNRSRWAYDGRAWGRRLPLAEAAVPSRGAD